MEIPAQPPAMIDDVHESALKFPLHEMHFFAPYGVLCVRNAMARRGLAFQQWG